MYADVEIYCLDDCLAFDVDVEDVENELTTVTVQCVEFGESVAEY